MATPTFSPANRITPEKFKAKYNQIGQYSLCRGAFGTQSDCQCLGYDALCGLAIMFYDKMDRDRSYMAVNKAQAEVYCSKYSEGFHRGWDGHYPNSDDAEFMMGYNDGKEITSKIQWERSRPNDGSYR